MVEIDDIPLPEFLQGPLATIAAAVAVVSSGLQGGLIEPLVTTLWAQAGALFAAASVGSTTLAPELGWLPDGMLQTAAVAFGVVFVLNRLWTAGSGLRDRIMGDR